MKNHGSLLLLTLIFIFSLLADFFANEKPIILYHNQQLFFPIFQSVTEFDLGGTLETKADFKDPFVVDLIKSQNGFFVMPPIPFSWHTISYSIPSPAPSKPTWQNLLGTDDQGRDALSRLIYAVRSSLLFGFILTILSLFFGILIGSIQGYFAGKVDLFFQRFVEIWSTIPIIFLLITMSAVIEPSFTILIAISLLFSWIAVASIARAEFLRLRNFEFVRASVALGASHKRIIFRHILPNAMPIIMSNAPFVMIGAISSLTALDFLGLGLPIGSASLGEMLSQGKNNLHAYWLWLPSLAASLLILTLLVKVSEGLRSH